MSAKASSSRTASERTASGRAASNRKPRTIPLSSACLLAALAFAAGLLFGTLATGLQSSTPTAQGQGVQQAPAANASESTLAHVRELEQLAAKQPNSVDTWVHLGNAYYDAQQTGEAIRAYEHALTLQPDNADVHTDLGTMYRLSGKFAQAIAHYNEAITRNPRHQNARFNKGIVLFYDLNQKPEGMAAWEALLTVLPEAKAPDGTPIRVMMDKLAGAS